MALDLLTCHRRISTTDTGKYHPQVIINLCTGGNCRTRVPGIDLLLDSNRGRDTLDQFHIGLGHSAKELSCV